MGRAPSIARLQERFARAATLIEPLRGPTASDALVSWFGRVNVGSSHEGWPLDRGAPMLPLMQLDLRAAPFRPAALRDIDVLTMFVGRGTFPSGTQNGDGWLVRAYPDGGALCALAAPAELQDAVSEMTRTGKPLRAVPIAYRMLERDLPDWPDVAMDNDIPEKISDIWEGHFGAARGCKLGGWPSLIQSEIFWAAGNEHPIAPTFVLQIDSVPEAQLDFLADTVCYIGRGTGNGYDAWAFDWQCD